MNHSALVTLFLEALNSKGGLLSVIGKNDEAMSCFNESLRYADNVIERATAKTSIANILQQQGKFDAALEAIEEGKNLLRGFKGTSGRTAGKSLAHAALLGKECWIFRMKGDMDRALNAVNSAMEVLGSIRVDTGTAAEIEALKAELNNDLAAVLYVKSDFSAALEIWKKNLCYYEEISDIPGVITASANTGNVYWQQGALDAAKDAFSKALSAAVKIGIKRHVGALANNLGLVHHELGEDDTAMIFYRKYLAISIEMGDKTGEGRAWSNIGIIYKNRGKYAEALACHEKQLSLSESSGDRSGISMSTGNIAMIHLNRGDLTKAENMYRRYLKINRAIGYKRGMGIAHLNLGAVHIKRRRYGVAEKAMREALRIFEAIGDRYFMGEAKIGFAEIYLGYAGSGFLGKAREFAEGALDEARKIKNLSLEAEACCILGTCGSRALNLLSEKEFRGKDILASSIKAAEHFKRSLALFKTLKRLRNEADALIEYGNFLKRLAALGIRIPGKNETGISCLERAKRIYRSLAIPFPKI